MPALSVIPPAVTPLPPMLIPPEALMSTVPSVPSTAARAPVLTLPPLPTLVMKMLSAEVRVPVLMPPLLSYSEMPPDTSTLPSVMLPP